MSWLGSLLGDMVFLAVMGGCAAILFESTARVVQWNARPMIPFAVDRLGAARLEADLDLPVKLALYERINITTDDVGARVEDVPARDIDRTNGVLFVGDSQVLGWGLTFAQTAASLLAHSLGVPQNKVAIIGSASEDPEKEMGWVVDYASHHSQRQNVEVVAVNMGNDADEMILGRSGTSFPSGRWLNSWLSHHSLAYLDLALLWSSVNEGTQGLHPEINYSMLYLNDREIDLLAQGMVESTESLINALPPADRRIVMIIPQDSQISMHEFDKYRTYYSSDSDFVLHRAAQSRAVERLDKLQEKIVRLLREKEIQVVALEPALRSAYGRTFLIDTNSHHLMAAGQVVAADSVFEALKASP
jgi:hypothetical protein